MLIYLQMIELSEERSKFERLYHQYRGLMLHVARQILHHDQDAEDAVHESFIKIAKNITKISEVDCPKTRAYIVIIVENTSIDILRKQKKQPVAQLHDAVGVSVEYHGTNELADCLLKLPAVDRSILLMRYDLGYSLRETARMLGVSEAAARKREQRAKDKLYRLCKGAELL